VADSIVYKSARVKRCILLIPFFFLIILEGSAQEKYAVDAGVIRFTSNAELEVIKASSNKLQGLLDATTNQFAFQVTVSTFRGFNGELQRVHFNEKYMESEMFPKAVFSGKIIEQIDFATDGIHEVRAKGDLTIHGQKQTRIIKTKVIIRNGSITVESAFKVPLSDHNIAIPSIVNQKIATEIEIFVNASMKAQ
jgi:hypothetical protein